MARISLKKKANPVAKASKLKTATTKPILNKEEKIIEPVIEPKKQDTEKNEIKTKGLDFVISSCIFLVFLLCPLFFTGLSAQGMGFEKMILFYFLTLLGTVAWATKSIITGEFRFKRTPLDWPILFILIFSIASTVVSVNQTASLVGSYGDSAKGLAGAVIFILFYYLLVNNINTEKIKKLFWMLTFSFSLVVVYSLLQLLGVFILPIEFTKIISFNPIGSLSSLAMFLVSIIPILVIAATQVNEINNKSKKTANGLIKIIVSVILIAGFTILVFLNGLVFWPAAIAGIIVLLLFMLSRVINTTNNNLIIPVTAFFLLIIFLVMGNFNIISLDIPGEVSLSPSASWDIAKESVKENPILGSGPSTFYYNFSKFKDVSLNASAYWNTRFSNSSGFIFELIASIGVISTLAVVYSILVILYICYKAIMSQREKDIQSILLAVLSSVIVILITSSMFAVNSSLVLISVLLFSLAATGALKVGKFKYKEINLAFHVSPKSNIAIALIFLTVSAGVVTMFTIGAKMYLGDHYARQSITEESLDARIEKMNKAIQLAPYQDIYYINIANNYIAKANQEATGDANQEIILSNLSQAIKYARLATDKAPDKVANVEFLALVYENASIYTRGGVTVWAKSLGDAYNKVIELEPNNPMVYYKIALLNIARADAESDETAKSNYFNKAIESYDLAISKKADLSAAYYGMGIAYERLQNINEAIEQIKSAVNTSSNNIDYAFELARLYFNRGIMNANSTTEEPIIQDIEQVECEEDDEDCEENLSIKTPTSTPPKTLIKRNEDLDTANQIFLNIIQVERSHANALYSLALLYQAVDEIENMDIVVEQLIGLLPEGEQKQRVERQFRK